MNLAYELHVLRHRFPGVVLWFGHATRRFWALVGDQLIEAENAPELSAAITGARTGPPPHVSPESTGPRSSPRPATSGTHPHNGLL